MSTLWFSARCSEVHTVEDNAEWYAKISSLTPHPSRVRCLSGAAYRHRIEDFPKEYFDLVVIDGGMNRYECLRIAEPYARPDGCLIIDDTDRGSNDDPERQALNRLTEQYGKEAISNLTGWTPGSFFVKTTTLCQLSRAKGKPR
jgi:predicted O-methyltransferase YrrM